jgi:hypothetical protein
MIGKDVLAGEISTSAHGKVFSWFNLGSGYVSSSANFSNVHSIVPLNQGDYGTLVSPDGSQVIFSQHTFSDQDEYKNPGSRFAAYMLFPPDYSLKEIIFPIEEGDGRLEVIQDVAWSPDERYALLNDYLLNSKGAATGSQTRVLDLETLKFVTDISENMQGKKSSFFWLTNLK